MKCKYLEEQVELGAFDYSSLDLPELLLKKFWDKECPEVAEKGFVKIACDDSGLLFFIKFEDEQIYTTVTEDNQKFWELGDVAEFFVAPEGADGAYWEIHVSPNNYIMDVKISSRDDMMAQKLEWDEIISHESGSEKTVKIADDGKSWEASVRVPWSAFGHKVRPAKDTQWKIAICRYNYPGKLSEPELSSTAPFSKCGFHRIEEYTSWTF